MDITVLIIDNKEQDRNALKSLLRTFSPKIRVLGEASNIDVAYKLIVDKNPNVVFLEIPMSGGGGFNLLKKFREAYFDVIFVANNNEYALKAIKLNPLDYLIKPIELVGLKETLKRLEISQARKSGSLIRNTTFSSKEKGIPLQTNNAVVYLAPNSIIHFEGDGDYTNVYTTDNLYISSRRLSEYKTMVKDNKIFFSIGKNCIVNVNCIKNYTKGKPCILTLNNKFTYEISRRKKSELLERLGR
jgi:two-component system LytT family response regulator